MKTIRIPGVSFLTLLGVLFIGLKLTGHIDWSWLWVLSPIWAPIALVFGGPIIILVVGMVVAGILTLFGRG